jgi:hypothetical protein
MNVVAEDNLSTERASELCTSCDLNPKLLLLLLPNNEHLQGYIIRLEWYYKTWTITFAPDILIYRLIL